MSIPSFPSPPPPRNIKGIIPIVATALSEQGHAKGALANLIDTHPKLAYALSEWLESGTWGHFQINRANGKYAWNKMETCRE